jgi:allantoinase
VEAVATARAMAFARMAGAPVHVVHLSSAAALGEVRAARAAGVAVSAETCPHYLVLTEDDLERWGPYAKCNPPLRSAETRDRLWEAVGAGVIDVLGTDHSPYLAEERTAFTHDIWGAPPGLPGLEEFLPLLLTAVNQNRLSLPRLVRLTSEQPSRLFGLWPRKGAVQAGSDADLVLIDLRSELVHDHRRLYTKAREAALVYDGMTFRGLPVQTIVRGRTVMRRGEVVGEPGWGRWVMP